MTVVDSRLGPGTLVFDTTHDFSVQVSSCSLVPSSNETDGTKTLGNTNPNKEVTFDWVISGSTISDWSSATGFVNWAMDHAGSYVTFTFTPSTDAGTHYTGTVNVRPIEIGGDVKMQSVVNFEFPLSAAPTRS